MHIIAKGNNFKLYINDKLSSEFTEHLPKAKRLKSGMIQLQIHDPDMIVYFRDLKLKGLEIDPLNMLKGGTAYEIHRNPFAISFVCKVSATRRCQDRKESVCFPLKVRLSPQ